MMNFEIKFSNRFDRKNESVVLNCGDKIILPDKSILGNFDSGLYRNIEFKGDKLIVLELEKGLEVTEYIAELIRSKWKHVYELFGLGQYIGVDFYRSPQTKLDDFNFSFWYFGDRVPGTIHKEHDFYELHTQILGEGSMQKFFKNDEGTMYESIILDPGQTHKPYFDAEGNYPWHRYAAISKSILMSIESPFPIPKNKK